MAIITVYNRGLLGLIFGTMVNTNQLRIVFRENYLIHPYAFWLYYLIFFLTAPFILYKTIQLFVPSDSVKYPLLLSIGIVLFFYAIRHLGILFFTILTNRAFEVVFYNYQIILSNTVLGILLIPIVFALAIGNTQLVKYILILSGILFTSIYLYRQARALVISLGYISRHTFHFFVYFCAVEIMPLLLIGKFLMSL